MRIASGSPFADVTGATRNIKLGREKQDADYVAKAAYSVHLICQDINPFHYVILFTVECFVAFSASPINSHKFPRLRDDIVKRGAQAPDELLDWTNTITTVTQPFSTGQNVLKISP